MSADSADTELKAGIASAFLYTLAVTVVIVGLLNSMPGIPGLDQALRDLTGRDWFTIRKYPTEWFYPIAFGVMMVCVALKHSMWRGWQDRSPIRRGLGLVLDIALVVAAIGISLTYVIEIESICLFDRISGERERLIADLGDKKPDASFSGIPTTAKNSAKA